LNAGSADLLLPAAVRGAVVFQADRQSAAHGS
jgi:hypothetical protein